MLINIKVIIKIIFTIHFFFDLYGKIANNPKNKYIKIAIMKIKLFILKKYAIDIHNAEKIMYLFLFSFPYFIAKYTANTEKGKLIKSP